MTLETISRDLQCTEYTAGSSYCSGIIEHIAASDLMSEVLVAEEENLLLITALNTEQTIRTANIVDAAGVLLVNGKIPQPGMVKLAKEFNLTLISTRVSMFAACAAVYSAMTREDD